MKISNMKKPSMVFMYVQYNAKKGRTLLAKVRDITPSRKDSQTGCEFYGILANYTD